MTDTVDYEGWAVAMCTLLDRIERISIDDDPPSYVSADVLDLCQTRFELAERYGLTVEILGEMTGRIQ